jgi:hypothetical protein
MAAIEIAVSRIILPPCLAAFPSLPPPPLDTPLDTEFDRDTPDTEFARTGPLPRLKLLPSVGAPPLTFARSLVDNPFRVLLVFALLFM